MGCDDQVDVFFGRPDFIDGSIKDAEIEPILHKAEAIIGECAEEYKKIFLDSYKSCMSKRLGFDIADASDFELVSDALTLMETLELDFHHFFYRLSESDFTAQTLAGEKETFGGNTRQAAIAQIEQFLTRYRERLDTAGIKLDSERSIAMKKANPSFVLRSWILDEAIDRVEHKGERTILQTLLQLATDPFGQHDTEDGKRFCGPVPSGTISGANAQCSCSS